MEMPTASAADAVPRPSPSMAPPPPVVVDPSSSSSSSSSANANVVSANVDNEELAMMMMAANNNSDAVVVANAKKEEEKFEMRVRMSKYINFALYLLTTMIVLGVIYVGVPAYGVFGDDYLWMKYQTLMTPSDYVNLIWIPVLSLLGLFVYASSFHPVMSKSPFVGYGDYYRRDDDDDNDDECVAAVVVVIDDPKRSIALVHFPVICLATMITIYSHDYGHMGWALIGSLVLVLDLSYVLGIQRGHMKAMKNDDRRGRGGGGPTERQDDVDVLTIPSEDLIENIASGGGMMEDGNGTTTARSALLYQYAALRLPFALYGGYALALSATYLNAFLINIEMPTWVYLIVANICLVGLCVVGLVLIWRGKAYGAGASLIWYMSGVVTELHEPTQPVYNEFSDNAIFTTYIVAGVSVLSLMTIVGVRVVKTLIKQDRLPQDLMTCGGRFRRGGNEHMDALGEDDEIVTDYVHA